MNQTRQGRGGDQLKKETVILIEPLFSLEMRRGDSFKQDAGAVDEPPLHIHEEVDKITDRVSRITQR
jgi:hypothetical protein